MHSGRNCVVVGGTHGIGLATARKLCDEGAALVVICSRKQKSIDEAIATSTSAQQKVLKGITCNVSDLDDIAKLFSFAQSNIGPGRHLDVLVSNVGVDPPSSGKALQADDKLFDKIFNTNVKAAWQLVKQFYPLMTRGSAILLVSSTGGFQPAMPGGIYGASKAALIGLGRALATELGPEGIRINTICPGLVKTRMSEAFWKGPYREVAENALFLRRLGEPEDIADVASFMVSDQARWMTGEAIVVSGGTQTRL